MLKCSKLILCSAVLNLSIFLSISFSYADVDKNKADDSILNNQKNSILSSNLESIFRNSGATIEANIGDWYKISVNDKSGWVYKEVFPIEVIKNSQDTKILNKNQTPVDKSQDMVEEEIQQKPSVISKKTDDVEEKDEDVQQDIEQNDEEVSNKADGVSEKVYDSKDTGDITAVIEGLITGDSVNVRKGPSTDDKVISQMDIGDNVDVLGISENWYNIKTKDGVVGWAYGAYVSTGYTVASRGEETTDWETSSNNRTQIVSYAKDLLGVRYVYGGTSRSGFDCSGFVWYVFNHFGIKLNRVACDQATQGTKVSKANLQPGDLVFFDTNGGMNHINHVGIYIGKGSFIHASSGSSKMKVVISDITSGFYNRCYMTGRRMLD